MENKIKIIKQYLIAQMIDPEYASPNLIADICRNVFGWELSSDEIVQLSDSI